MHRRHRSLITWVLFVHFSAWSVLPPQVGNFARAQAPAAQVPNVVGLAAREARQVVESAGLVARFQLGPSAPAAALRLTVKESVPPAATRVAPGATVTITLFADETAPASSPGTPDRSSRAPLPRREIVTVRAVPAGGLELEVVDPNSGTLVAVSTDLSINAGPTTLDLTRYLRSEPNTPGILGLKWRTNWEKRVRHDGRAAAIDERFGRTPFALESAGRYRSVNGDLLVVDVASARLSRADGGEEEFDEQGRLVRVREPGGARFDVRYGSGGELTSVEGPFGAFLRFNYDAERRVTLVSSSTGARVAYAYETGEADASSRDAVRYEYDSSLRVSRSEHPARGAFSYVYDAQGRVVERQTAAGGKHRYQFDDAENRVLITDAAGQTTRLSRTADGRRLELVDPRGGVGGLEQDEAGRLTKLKLPTGDGVTFRYDHFGRIAGMDPGRTGMLDIRYDDAVNLPVSITERGETTRFAYDAERRLTGVATGDDDPASLSLAWNSAGLLDSIRTGTRVDGRFEYDAEGRPASLTDARGGVTRFEYDAPGNVVRRSGPLGQTWRAEYDHRGRLVAESDSLDARTRYVYDDRGLLAQSIDALGGVSSTTWSATGEPTELTAPNGDRVRCVYDAADRLTSLVRAGGSTVKYSYDAAGDVATTTDPLGGVRRIERDAAGRIVRQVDAAGRTTRMEYDAEGRMTKKIPADGPEISYRYAEGRLVAVDDGRFPVLYEYDKRGLCTAVNYPALRRTLRYEYDALGQVARFVDSEGRALQYRYDTVGRLTSMRFADGREIAVVNDVRDRRTELALPGGVRAKMGYDSEDRLTSLEWSTPSARPASWKYEYDPLGRHTKGVAADGRTTKFAYDASGQLTEAVRDDAKTEFAYAPGGNRTQMVRDGVTTRYQFDADDRVLAAGDETLRYDDSGNLVERRGPQGATKYEFDASDRLIKVTLPGGDVVEYGYAPTGDRIWRQDKQGRTWYVSDGLNVVAELDEQLRATSSYVHLPEADRPVMMTRNGADFALLADERGDVRRVVDAEGKTAAEFDYDPFGVPGGPPQVLGCSFGFQGREYDAATGLYYFRARWYDPRLGRFISADPVAGDVAQPISLNPYVFAFNDPIGRSDPSGTQPPNSFDPSIKSVKLPSNAYRPPPPPPPPPIGQLMKDGIKAAGGFKTLVKTGIVTAIVTTGLETINIEPEVRKLPLPERPNFRAKGYIKAVGSVAGSTVASIASGALVGLTMTNPTGWIALGIVGVIGGFGSLGGGKLGEEVGDRLFPKPVDPGSVPPTGPPQQNPVTIVTPPADEKDFADPTAGRGGPRGPPAHSNLPIVDPRDFAGIDPKKPLPPGVTPGSVRYVVLAQCTICKKVHHGGVFETDAAAQAKAGEMRSNPRFTVSIVATTVPKDGP